ncbi:peptidylprolyl isomerase [Pelagovum pacificum]|uniref:Parvulin-like PPIase n=1 Tax=Pelagovum pacificum TaxID=2588711 RepID=A0A5C5GCU2_9RHOB|nr:peptidylprolyl isomerase [Pelagovum pacificum]QQA41390.1 peptidylprolyl isomerase [Pelagovum pacificum]TNY31807.1 peptidylprolyl isomerase [Pelagovum pacificum]
MTFRTLAAAALAFCLTMSGAAAQSPYSAAITVNDDAISFYEIDQRVRLLELFNTPGDLPELAREQLIDDRLKLQELRRVGLSLSDEALQAALNDFAGRADLPYDQFIGQINGAGVAEETLRDFVLVGVSWRDYIRSRYSSRTNITDRDVTLELDRAAGTGSELEVLLSEIIIPAPPPRAAEAAAIANQIAQTRSTATFEAAAREYSALPSRENGGRLEWLPLDNYPGPIQGLIMSLQPGEVTNPIPIPNGIALFQLRAVREARTSQPVPSELDYAVLYIPGGRSDAALSQVARIDARADSCDDLYDERGLQLAREQQPVGQVPGDIALELAKLDRGEASWGLTSGDGQSLLYVMLCDRIYADAPSRDAVADALRSQRLSRFADQTVAQLRANAVIRPPQ